MFLRAWALSLAAATLRCASSGAAAAQPRVSPPVVSAAPAAPLRSFAGPVRSIEAKGQSLELPLPDAPGWRRDPTETQSWVAMHRQSESRLVVRAWQHDSVARVEDCERQARLWRPDLPELEPAGVVDVRQATLAGSYESQVRVGVLAHGSELFGYALAFGSDARSCLMLAFSTAASGPGAARVIAERLSIISRGVFERVRRLGINDRVITPRP